MKLQGFIVESASKPVEALGPPACPGANCPMAFLIKPGSASPNNEALNHPVDSLRGLPVSASITSSTRCMKLLVKSRLPSLHPVQSKGGNSVFSLVTSNSERSEERRVGIECVRTCRSRGSRYKKKK